MRANSKSFPSSMNSAGETGDHVMAVLSRLTMPIITTLHTVLSEPTPVPRPRSDRRCIVQGRRHGRESRELLRTVYRVAAEKVDVIPHGIPAFAFVEPDQAKAKFGFSAGPSFLRFGRLSPNKGIEVVHPEKPW
jgi:glycosyltransferase involved in cell wall biosynthesis